MRYSGLCAALLVMVVVFLVVKVKLVVLDWRGAGQGLLEDLFNLLLLLLLLLMLLLVLLVLRLPRDGAVAAAAAAAAALE